MNQGYLIRKKSGLRAWIRNIEVKDAFKTGLAASLSLILGLGFSKITNRPDTFISGLWCVMAAIVVMQTHLEGTYKAAWVRFLGVLVGSLAGATFINLLGSDALTLGISVFFTIIICSILNIKESFRIASLSTAIIMVQADLSTITSPWIFSTFRFLDSCIGILTALFVAYVIWPEKAIENLRINLIKIVFMTGKYYRLALDIEGQNESNLRAIDKLLAEIQDLLEKNREYRQEVKLEFLNKESQIDGWMLLTNQLETTIESLISLAKVPKEPLTKIFDDSLANQVANLVGETDLAFQSIEKMLTSQIGQTASEDIEKSIEALSGELLRFRATRTTRKFNLEDVENFFVFFYQLKAIAYSLEKMQQIIHELYAPRSSYTYSS